jgi:hypothetical protein
MANHDKDKTDPDLDGFWIRYIPRMPDKGHRPSAAHHFQAQEKIKKLDRLAANRRPGRGGDFLSAQLWSYGAMVLLIVSPIAALNHYFDGHMLLSVADLAIGLPLAVWLLRKGVREAG